MSAVDATPSTTRPDDTECASGFFTYVALAPDGDIVNTLSAQIDKVTRYYGALDENAASWNYAPGKWSRREVLGHLCDIERVFGFRCAVIARGDVAPQPSFDQNAWLAAGRYTERPMTEVLAEWIALRQSSILLARGLGDDAWARRGVAGDNPFTVRSIVWLLAGHVESHLDVLASRYAPWPRSPVVSGATRA